MSDGSGGAGLHMSPENVRTAFEMTSSGVEVIQQIRELTQNALEATGRANAADGLLKRVFLMPHKDNPEYLCIMDTGDGMTKDQLYELTGMFSSGNEQGVTKNFGIGFKIAVFPHNKLGIVIESWKEGKGVAGEIRYFPEINDYVFYNREFETPEGKVFQDVYDLPEGKCPFPLGSGTRITLKGNTGLPTVDCPEGERGGFRWVAHAVNERFYTVPEETIIHIHSPRVEDGEEKIEHNIAHGQKYFLDRDSENLHGEMQVTDSNLNKFTARWWVLPKRNSVGKNYYRSSGHTALLYQNELHEVTNSNTHSNNELRNFGVNQRCVIYIEPDTTTALVQANAQRNGLLVNGKKIDWAGIQEDFSQRIPAEITNALNADYSDTKDVVDRIKERLAASARKNASKNKTIEREDGNVAHDKEHEKEEEVPAFKRTGDKNVPPRPYKPGRHGPIRKTLPVSEIDADIAEIVRGAELLTSGAIGIVMSDEDDGMAGHYSDISRILTIQRQWRPYLEMKREMLQKFQFLCGSNWDDTLEESFTDLILEEHAVDLGERIHIIRKFADTHDAWNWTNLTKLGFSSEAISLAAMPTERRNQAIIQKIRDSQLYIKNKASRHETRATV